MLKLPTSIFSGLAVEQVFDFVNRAVWPNHKFPLVDEVDLHCVAVG